MNSLIEPFGHLVTIDLYNCKSGACDDISLCYSFLEEIVHKLNMTKQSPPFIFKSDGKTYPDKAGLSGWVPLIESGIQIHTLSCKNFISIDVYSCRSFSVEDISNYIKNYFGAEELETNYIKRGIKYNNG